MPTNQDLVFKITVDPSGAVKGVGQVEDAFEGLQEESDDTSNALTELIKSMGGVGAGLVVMNQGLELATKAFDALIGPIKEVTQLFSIQERAEKRLANALKLNSEFTRQAMEDFKEFASELQNVSTQGDEVTLNMLANAKAIGISNDAAKELLTTSVDLAAAVDKDVQPVFEALLNTFKGEAGEVSKFAPELANLTKEALKNGEAIEILGEKFKGFAEENVKTFDGSLTQLMNSFGDLQETIGKTISDFFDLPGSFLTAKDLVEDLNSVLISLMPSIMEVRDFLVEFGSAVAEVFTEVADGINQSIDDIGLRDFVDQTMMLLDDLGNSASLTKILDFFRALLQAVNAIDFSRLIRESKVLLGALVAIASPAIIKGIIGIGAAFATTVAPVILLTAKIALITAGLITVASAVDIVIRNFESMGDILDASLTSLANTVQTTFLEMKESIGASIQELLQDVATATSAVLPSLSSSVSEAAKEIGDSLAETRKELDFLASDSEFQARRIEEAVADIDLGFVGTAFDEGKKFIKTFNEELDASVQTVKLAQQGLEDLNKELGKTGGNKGPKIVDKEAVAALRAARLETEALQLALGNIGQDAATIARAQTEFDQKRIDARKADLALQGKLNASLAKELDMQKELLGQITEANIALSQQEALRDLRQENLEAELQLANIGATTLQTIDNQLKMDMMRLDLKREQLRLQGVLTPELEKELRLQKELLEATSGARKEQASTPQIISPDQKSEIAALFGDATADFTAGITSALASFASPIEAFKGGVTAFADSLISFINFIPEMINKIADVFQALNEFPQKLIDSVQRLISEIGKVFKETIQNLIESIPTIVADIIQFVFEDLPDILVKLIEKLPTILIDGFLDRIPEIVTSLVKGLISSIPRLGAALMKALIKGAPRIAIAMVEVMAVEIPKAIIKGIMEGISAIADAVKSIFTGGTISFDTSQIEDTIANIGKTLQKATEDVFAVVDLEAAKRGFAQAKEISAAIDDATKRAVDLLRKVWQELRNAWLWVFNNILKPLLDGIREVWLFVWERIFQPMINALREVWLFVWERILQPAWEAIKAVFQFISDSILRPAWEAIRKVFEGVVGMITKAMDFAAKTLRSVFDFFVGAVKAVFNFVKNSIFEPIRSSLLSTFNTFRTIATKFIDSLRGAVNFVKSTFNNITEGFKIAFKVIFDTVFMPLLRAFSRLKDVVFKPIADLLKSPFDGLKNALNAIIGPFRDLANALKNFSPSIGGGGGGGGGFIESVGSALGFNEGGPVDMLGVGDTKNIKVRGGEFVMNPVGRQTIGDNALNAANAGRLAPMGQQGNQEFNISVTINEAQNVDGRALAEEVIEKIKNDSEVKGRFIMGTSGLR